MDDRTIVRARALPRDIAAGRAGLDLESALRLAASGSLSTVRIGIAPAFGRIGRRTVEFVSGSFPADPVDDAQADRALAPPHSGDDADIALEVTLISGLIVMPSFDERRTVTGYELHVSYVGELLAAGIETAVDLVLVRGHEPLGDDDPEPDRSATIAALVDWASRSAGRIRRTLADITPPDDETSSVLRTLAEGAFGRAAVGAIAASLTSAKPIAVTQVVGRIRSELLREGRRERRRLCREEFTALAGFDRYAETFGRARSMRRRHILIVGPTNSGKTHAALQVAASAASAEILSPLRLLALEHFEAMDAKGIPTGLVTGEEVFDDPSFTHRARTIETLDTNRVVEVCVIDEIQLLTDPKRGWAWTRAFLGASAQTVVSTGSENAVEAVMRLAALVDEPLEIVRLRPEDPIELLKNPVRIGELETGDAVIAFSRRAVHEWRDRIVASGRSVATIYGALSPDVRRSEAARFRSGEAQVLVATDAIGMGLNLPIRRVLMTDTRKFDGKETVPMDAAAITQIVGRAGRRGTGTSGFAGTVSGVPADLSRIANALHRGPGRLRGRPRIRPNRETVELAAEHLGMESLAEVLAFLDENLMRSHPDLMLADMSEQIELARVVDRSSLSVGDRFVYSCAPVRTRSETDMRHLASWACLHGAGQIVPPPAFVGATMMDAEDYVLRATAWLWLSRRWPDVYQDEETVSRDVRRAEIDLADGLAISSRSRSNTARDARRKM